MSGAALAPLLLALHFAATFYMIGLIWFVQRVHYPLFAGVGSATFSAYEREHVARTGPVVGPPMAIEAATALALVAVPLPGVPPLMPWLGIALLVVIWLSTALLQVPRHRDLSAGFEAAVHHRLVATNWIRTAAWSLRGALLVWLAAHAWAGGAA